MLNIRPVSDLKNIEEILSEVSPGCPVFLTVNGRGRYVIMDIDDYDKQKATIEIMSKLAESQQDIARGNVYSLEEVDKMLGLSN